jgi:hypothetical protein
VTFFAEAYHLVRAAQNFLENQIENPFPAYAVDMVNIGLDLPALGNAPLAATLATSVMVPLDYNGPFTGTEKDELNGVLDLGSRRAWQLLTQVPPSFSVLKSSRSVSPVLW